MDLSASVGIRLAPAELPGALDTLRPRIEAEPTPELHLAAGLVNYLIADFVSGAEHLEVAYLGFKDSRQTRRAAVAATHLGRLFQDGVGNEPVARGWIARAQRLLRDEGDCVERGWAALPLTGCNITNATELEQRAEWALGIAREFGDVDLECKALADYGIALIGHGQFDKGLELIDESMTMVSSGECDNAFITAQVRCCLISACCRTGDLPRLEGWLAVLTKAEPALFGADARPNMLLAHCQTEYGVLLCEAGRWMEAETALRRGTDVAASLHHHFRAQSRAALASLRIDQGRLAEAATLLSGFEQRWETQTPLARLHLARGDTELAAAVARQALRVFVDDRPRGTPILAVLAEAEIANGNLEAARDAVEALEQAAQDVARPPVQAAAHRARAQLLRARDEHAAAVTELESALRLIPGDDWPLLAAELHLELAGAVAATHRPLALAEARRALAVFGRVGAAKMHAAQALLHELGDVAAGPRLPDAIGRLTPREREILLLLAQGMTNPQIADQLVIAPKTAEHHVGAILRKLQLSSRSEAAVYAATLAL